MKINSSYPYPVLYMNNDDYTKSSFSTELSVNDSFGYLQIKAKFNLDNQGIKTLIENGSCVYLIHIECGYTSFRRAYETKQDILEVSILNNELRGKITIHSFIVAKEKIENYTNESLNLWYKGIDISFEKGNFLAIGEAIETTLFEDQTELLNLPSIITVTKSLRTEFMDVDIHSDNITVSLPEYEYNQYAASGNSTLKNTILSTVIVPSLVYVFSKVGENRGDLEQYTWYQVLEKIFSENNYHLEDVGTDLLSPLKAAQLVLRKPLRSSFEEIERLNGRED
jgi:hypothetical protein